ncbi:MAG: cobyric acid synthase [Chloroflexi bacterium]|nr:cobyric acid synthase [Chloroflexota bacterium]
MKICKCLMVQGTASSVGKSLLVTALCRILRQDGIDVAPFKAQNMSNNSYATTEGLEIGRAQAVQAEAAGVEATADMNPILLKPETEDRSQVVVRGKPLDRMQARDYFAMRDRLWAVVTESLDRLSAQHEVVVIEGAGSPAEVNLHDRDIVNMRVALYCGAPVILVADIDRGGVFASIVGTLELLEPEERRLVAGLVINKFRGDLSLLTPGLDWLAARTGVPVLGVLPFIKDPGIAEEDSIAIERRRAMKSRQDYLIDVAVMGLPHISNFDDFDPLEREQSIRLRYVEAGDDLGQPDLIVLPGTKSTVADLEWLRNTGFASRIRGMAAAGTAVIGVCGGYQMLGAWIADSGNVESSKRAMAGLSMLPVSTEFHPVKSTRQVTATVLPSPGLLAGAADASISGYEIHMGRTSREAGSPAFRIDGQLEEDRPSQDGCVSADGNVFGTYLHGLFESDAVRSAILDHLARRKGIELPPPCPRPGRQERYDRLAAFVREHLDMRALYGLIGSGRSGGGVPPVK